MRISGVRTTLFRDGTARYPGARETARCLVEVITDCGLAGTAVAPAAAATVVEVLTRDVLAGEDPRSAVHLWERVGRAVSPVPDLPTASARAALDIALWDIKARANDEPLWKTLGGSQPRANAHLHCAAWQADADSVFDWYRVLSSATGIRSGSLPLCGDPALDLQRLAHLKQALKATDPECALMVHFESPVGPADAIRHVRTLESEIDLTWVRSPVGDYRAAKQVSDSIAAAVCMGRGFTDVAAYRPYLEHYAANVLELDLSLLGISGTIRMADAAFGFELPVALSSPAGDLGVQMFSALPTAMSVAIDSCDEARGGSVIGSTVTFRDGRAVAGDEPGNGLIVDRDALRSSIVTC